MDRRAVLNAVLETLETRLVRSTTTPSAVEQLMLELINRARLDPVGEASFYSTYSDSRGVAFSGQLNEGLPANTISSTPKQPLAFNSSLIDAARAQSNYMGTAHVASHTGSGGSSWQQRIASAGYTGATASDENIDIYYSLNTLAPEATALQQHADLFTDLVLSDRAHRKTMLNDTFKEIGIGITMHNDWNRPNGINNAQEETENYATRNSQAYLTGVAISDKVVKDSFYNIGEGIAGVTVTAKRKSDNHIYTTTTWASGGYTLALPAGTYDISGTGSTLGSTITYKDVVVGTANIKKDFITGHTGDESSNFAKIIDRTLAVYGTSGNDVITVSQVGASYVVSMNGASKTFAASLIDKFGVIGGAGNDKLQNISSIPAYLEGGDGKDTLIGGGGDDSLYGDGSPDNVSGGLGNDVLVGSGGGDFLQGGAGNDKLYGGAGNDVLNGGSNNDRIYAGAGNDSVSGENGNDVLYGELGADILNGGGNTDASDNDSLDTRIAVELFV